MVTDFVIRYKSEPVRDDSGDILLMNPILNDDRYITIHLIRGEGRENIQLRIQDAKRLHSDLIRFIAAMDQMLPEGEAWKKMQASNYALDRLSDRHRYLRKYRILGDREMLVALEVKLQQAIGDAERHAQFLRGEIDGQSHTILSLDEALQNVTGDSPLADALKKAVSVSSSTNGSQPGQDREAALASVLRGYKKGRSNDQKRRRR